MRILLLMCLLCVAAHFEIYAQNNFGKVSGIVKDVQTSLPLSYAAVAVIHPNDSSVAAEGIADSVGHFFISSVPFGNYYLKVSSVGYEILKTNIFIISPNHIENNFGTISLQPSSDILKTVNIKAKQIAVEQKEDTIEYNSKAYKTHPDATAEDLVNKMPGISTDNSGNVTAHGEQVKQVLVDGKPFFGDDPAMALKNLPADVIDKIQVFDKASDQAQFTGFDDGNALKTINILTKPGMHNGEFGKVYAGYGTDDRYTAGGNTNIFDGERRISIIGLFNNVNEQNFSTQDLLGVIGSSGGGHGGRGTGGGGNGGNNSNNFLVGPQPGISTTNSIGLNYSDKWGKKIKVVGSYFFNGTNNVNGSTLTRNYITSKDNGLLYNEADTSNNKNYNHRFNLRLEYEIDSMNKIIITPKANLQRNNSTSSILGYNLIYSPFFWEYDLESKTDNNSPSNNSGYNYSNNFLFQHKFKKRGRTISLNVANSGNSKTGIGNLNSLNSYYFLNDSTIFNQQTNSNTNGYTVAGSLNYTEPINSFSQLQFNYSPSYTNNKTDQEVKNYDYFWQMYSDLDTILSNKYKSTYVTNRGGAAYRFRKKKCNFMVGVNYQYATLSGNEIFPTTFMLEKNFSNVLPSAMLNYRFSGGKNLRIIYRASTNTPSISQLQNVVNNSNPLLLSTGNPNLKQDYEHTITVRYGKTDRRNASGLFLYLYGNYAQNYIGNSTLIPARDTIINNDIILNRGSQLTKPVNLQGYWNAKSLLTYAFPIIGSKCNLNFNGGLTYNRTPALINNVTNIADNYNVSGGTGLSSNISENIDFTISYTANYSIVNNTLQTQSNNNYFYHTASLKFNWIFLKGFVINTSMAHTLYSGLSQNYNQNYLLWNASLGRKFLKNKSLELKVTVFDILNQNNSISRSVTDTYIQDTQTQVLHRYYMLMLTYTFKNFKKK